MKKMRVAVIGIGFIGTAHIEALRRLGFVDVVAISDAVSAEEKAAALFVPKGYADYRKMIEEEQLDAVHICTPNCYHYEMAMFAMRHGVHVMLEKPFTVSLYEAVKLRDYAKERNLVVGLNHSLRMNPQVQEMKALVQAGKVGNIFAVHGSYLQDWLFLDTDWSWRLEPEMSGKTRAFSDIGSHWIDMVENILGMRAVELLAEFNTVHKTRKKPLAETKTFSGPATDAGFEEREIHTEDWCSVLFKFENGAIGSLNVSQVTAGRKNQQIIDISGSRCSLHWDSDVSNNLWIGRREAYNQDVVKDPALLEQAAREVVGYPGGHLEGFPDTFKQQFAAFYRAVETNDTTQSLFATFDDGCREMLLNDKVYESAMKRAWVTI
jgi:predicted dehydrogenase